jgi:hypothetical protein
MDSLIDRSLMSQIEGRIARISQAQHELARQKQELIEMRTQLRISGRLPHSILAAIEEPTGV